MKELSDVEALFVEEVLDVHGEYVTDLLRDSIEEKGLRLSDELIESIEYKVERRGSDFVLVISFLSYGRAVEILSNKSRRLKHNAKLKEQHKKALRRSKQKDTRFYAKNVYGSINRLLSRMSNEYSEEEIKRLKGILENKVGH